ncbi:hypothetical protein RF644_02305 [Kocuria sp. CPCC 205258]|uniref:hypothetical protein n=1 Tax=Kocuria sp. CPCC 205258 TaxID=3073552 RepID=UPI0034D55435
MSTSTGPRELLRDPPQHPRGRRTVAAAAALLLGATGISASTAATEVTVRNPSAAPRLTPGPVSSEHGYPAWYEDANGLRTELCLDGTDPLCGFVPEEGFDPAQPTVFPDNFPGESFYMLAGSEIDIPGGGEATLTLAVEAAWANEQVVEGDQVVFSRQRVDVDDAEPFTTLTFHHPYGTVTIDTDDRGRGRLVEDVSPAIGNFTTPGKGDIGPFLQWDSGAPEGYLGDPDVEHAVTGGPLRNTFEVETRTGETATNDQFSVMGKISTNHGVQADRAVVNGDHLDVFATSRGDQLEVVGQDGAFETIPMEKDEGDSERAYARIPLTGPAPETVTVRNIGDDPVSTAEVAVADVSVATGATYDGTDLTVTATSTSATELEVEGFGPLTAGTDGKFPTVAPPVEVTVSAAGKGETTVPVVVTGGDASPAGVDPADPQPDPGPVTDNTPDNPDQGTDPGTEPGTEPGTDPEPAPLTAEIAAVADPVLRGGSLQLDAGAPQDGVTYEWTQLSGTKVNITNGDTTKPTIEVPAVFTTTTARTPEASGPAVIKLVATGANGETAEDEVTVNVESNDIVTVTENQSRHRLGKEIRITGTSVLRDTANGLRPATHVNIYNADTDAYIGTASVDASGAWSLRAKPGPAQQVANVLVQSTGGGVAEGTMLTR